MENDHFDNTNGAERPLPNNGEQQYQAEPPQTGESRGRRLARAASVERESGEIERADRLTHSAAIEALTRQLGEARSLEVREAQERIDRISQEETIAALKRKGELSPEIEELRDILSARFNRSVSRFTPQEVEDFYLWESDATTEIRDRKAEVIDEVIVRTLEGKRARRDQGIFEPLEELNHKYTLWERGEIDTSTGFDTEPYIPSKGEGFGSRHSETAFGAYDEEADKGYSHDDYDDEARYNELMIQDFKDGIIDEEELSELIDLDLGDKYVYGPYTANELSELEDLSWRTYIDAIDHRAKSHAGRLLETSIPARSNDIITDLGNYYIGELIATKRRLGARDLVSTAAALGLESQDLLSAKGADGKSVDEVRELRKNLGWCSYYMARICNIQVEAFTEKEFKKNARDMNIPDEAIDKLEPIAKERREYARTLSQNQQLRHRYDRARPVSGEFFTEAMNRAEGWTEKEDSERNKTYNVYLLRLDEWLNRAERVYDTLTTSRDESSTEAEGIPNIFGTISAEDKPQLPSAEQGQE